MRLRSALLSSAAVLLLVPAGASAQCQGAAGVGAVEEYCESIPDGAGGRDQRGASSGGGRQVPQSAEQELSGSRDGQAVLGLAGGPGSGGSGGSAGSDKGSKSGSKNRGGGSSGSTDSGERGSASPEEREPSGSPLAAATNAVEQGSTAGSGLVWGLAALTALGAGGAVLLRRRSV